MNTLIKPGLFLSFILMMVSACANASGGIALGATRVIYPADAKQTSLAITGPALPADRESLFYMNVKAIPSVNKAKTENNNVLQLAILSRIKLFVRPNNLAMQPEEALSQLRFERAGNHLKVSNASPYYITLVNLKLGGKTLDNLMVAPKSAAQQVLPAGAGGTLSWQSVNDYGAITPARSVNL